MAQTAIAANEQKEQIEACRKALGPLARISPKGERLPVNKEKDGDAEPKYTGQYRINRCRKAVILKGEDIAAAKRAYDDPKATLEQLQKALRPFARIPDDFRIEDNNAPVFVFPGEDGKDVAITNAILQAAKELAL